MVIDGGAPFEPESLFQMHTFLSVQFDKGTLAAFAERKLLRTLLDDALGAIAFGRGRLVEETRIWFEAGDRGEATAVWVCESLGLDYPAVRTRALAIYTAREQKGEFNVEYVSRRKRRVLRRAVVSSPEPATGAEAVPVAAAGPALGDAEAPTLAVVGE